MKKRTHNNMIRKAISVVASAALVLSMVSFTGCAPASDASIDDDATALADTADDAKADAEAELSIIANAAHIKSEAGKLITYHYPNLVVVNKGAKKIRSITIQFTTQIESGDSINLDVTGVNTKFTIFGTKAGNKSVNTVSNEGLTAQEWQDYLREHMTITLNRNENMVKGLRMIASLSPVTRTLDYNSTNGHYYELISETVNWQEARYRASQKSYLGMRGYLANITSAEENRILGSLSGAATWIGATCMPDLIRTEDKTPSSVFAFSSYRIYLKSENESYAAFPTTKVLDTRAGAISNAHNLGTGSTQMDWYWVTGPEAYEKDENGNLKTDANGNLIYHPQVFSRGTSSKYLHNNSVLIDQNDSSKGYHFSNWSTTEPNNSNCEYVAHILTTAPANDSANKYWNDFYANNNSATAYLVEYGGLEDTDLAAAGKEVKSTDVNANVDVYVKLDIDIDTSGRTITTTVDDITVGENLTKPLNVIESVNGDLDIKKTNADGTKETVKPTRTYYIQDATATGGWRELGEDDLNENGEPFHAGTYKIQSTAVNAYDSNGDEVLYRGGTATFKIKPKTIDLLDSEKPLVTKVYDGTLSADTSKIDITDFVMPGANVKLTCDTTGTFNKLSVGEASKVIITKALLEGTDAADYNLKTLDDTGKAEVKAAITPRDLVLTTTSNVSWGLEGQGVVDPTGAALAPVTNLAIHKAEATSWPSNELAPRDAYSLTETILGAVTFEPRCNSTVLDEDDPKAGLYEVLTFYANVNPNVKSSATLNGDDEAENANGNANANANVNIADEGTPLASADLLAADDGIVVETTTDINVAAPPLLDPLDKIEAVKLQDGRYDIGNYILSINNPSILITADPLKENDFSKTTEFIDGVITEKAAGTSGTMSEDKLLDLVETVAGEDLPTGTPTITITKDGKPVDKIDPSEVGTYAVVATYPGADGNDTVVRVAYNIASQEPMHSEQSVKVAKNTSAEPVSKQDLDNLVKERLGSWIPAGEDAVVSISKAGTSKDEIDLATPGVYTVLLTYMDPEGVVREVELTYEVLDADDAPLAQEQIRKPIEPDGKPTTKDDIIKKVEETYGGGLPEDKEPTITITRDGQPVDEIDPSIPGNYEVTVTYPGGEGEEDKVIKMTYTYYEEPKAPEEPGSGEGNGDNGSEGGEGTSGDTNTGDEQGEGSDNKPNGQRGQEGDNKNNGIEDQTGALSPEGPDNNDGSQQGAGGNGFTGDNVTQDGNNSAGAGDVQSGAKGFKGFADNAQRFLAQTGDPVFLAGCGIAVVAVIAIVVLVVTARKKKQQ